MDDYDPSFDEDRQCCKESCIVVYIRGITTAHCYRGTRESWEAAEATGYFRDSPSSCVMIVGATD